MPVKETEIIKFIFIYNQENIVIPYGSPNSW
jgi:hypothetical protein